jgi:YfiH family protein
MEHFFFRNIGDLKLLVCNPLERIGFKNAFSSRLGGVSPLPVDALDLGSPRHQGERENVIENRRRFLDALDAMDWTLVTAKQVHAADVRFVNGLEDARSEPRACDALTANTPGILLAVQTADCLPILIADERSGAFSAAHAGWRGTLAGIVARTVERMQQEFGSRPQDLHAALGPAISAAVFEVGPEVLVEFKDRFNYAEELISDTRASGKGHLNLNLANVRQLIACGVRDDRIYDSALCSWMRNDLFFSHRRERGHEKPVGRLMGVIGKGR